MPGDSEAFDPTGIFDGYTDPEPYEAPEEDKRLVGLLNDWLDQAKAGRYAYEKDWQINFHYLKGDQLVYRHKLTGDIVRISQEDSKRLRSVNNILRPTARSYVGKLTKMIPTCKVLPATADWEEQHGSRVGDAVLQYARRKEKLDKLYGKLMNALPHAGNAFAELVWDPQAGKEIAFCEVCDFYTYDVEEFEGTPCPQCSQQREQELQVQQTELEAQVAEATTEALAQTPPGMDELAEQLVDPAALEAPEIQQLGPLAPDQEPPVLLRTTEGDFRVIYRSAREIYVSPGAKCVTELDRYATVETVPVSEARRRFPDFAPFIHAEDGLYSDRYGQWNTNNTDIMATTLILSDHVQIKTFHEAPTDAYPEGRFMVVINDMLVEEREHPYYKLFGRFGLFHFGADENEGEFYFEPWLNNAVHRQRELNALESNTREHTERLLRRKLLVPVGAMISPDELDSTVGQVVTYSPANGNPMPLEVPELSPGVWNRRQELKEDVRIQASVSEPEMGIAGSDPNGRAMAIINAETDQQIGPIVARNNDEWRELHRCILVLVSNYYAETRLITVSGPQGLQTFSLAELNLTPGWDIEIEIDDGLSRNPQVRFNQAVQMAQVGMFMDPATGGFDKRAFARYARLRMSDEGYDVEAMQRAAASQIPYLLQRGEQYVPRLYDDPVIFEEELRVWLIGQGRRSDPQLVEQVQQIWMYYTQWLQAQAMPSMGAEIAGQGSQPGQLSAEGGTPNSQLGSDVHAQASQQVRAADSSGEQLANAAASGDV